MGMYCCCGVKKMSSGWVCECDWNGWFLCFDNEDSPKNVPIKATPDLDGTYRVRVFEDGDDYEQETEFSVTPKNWGEYTNQQVSNWKVAYWDGWMGYRGVYAWKALPEAPEMSPDPIDIYGKSVLLTDPPKEWPPENPEDAVFIPLGIGYWAYPARGLPPSPTPPPEEAPK